MNTALLSRFDLVFILLDRPNAEKDKYLSEHVMALHSGVDKSVRVDWNSGFNSTDILSESSLSLQKRLQLAPNESLDLIPKKLLRVYIAYARKYVHPKLSSEAKAVLQQFYLDLRSKHKNDTTPITTRQLEALIRLGEARARAELREIVTELDAKDVIEIMNSSLLQTYEDEDGILDFTRSQMGSGMSKRSEINRFVSHLSKISQIRFNNIFTTDMLLSAAKGKLL
ncbi:DNA helicase MCM8 [Smittium culicis]|uniref:DNA helicase MCM8 n=2 Tax=Smittium culicis TaxID=133412 RepID=A0A1R1XSF4_9FUNG|nr:DNA helicase MCM8 [Smittium culicis]